MYNPKSKVESFKLLGVTISNNLTWHAHIKEVIKKASKRLYYLTQLKRARLPVEDLVLFYTSCVRSVMDYAVLYNTALKSGRLIGGLASRDIE